MAAGLSRLVAMGPSGVTTPGSSQDYANNASFMKDTRTKWTRFWADWPTLQPEATKTPDKGSGATRLAALDRQIAAANADGVNVMLTVYRFPRWANGTASLTPDQDASFQLPDRVEEGGTHRKALEMRIPSDLSPTSRFASFLDFLIGRYNSGNPQRPGTIAALEVCNEANLTYWPQMGPSPTSNPYDPGTVTIQNAIAKMFIAAQQVNARYGNRVLLLGPGNAERSTDGRLGTSYTTTTRRTLLRLNALGFSAGRSFGWSTHNYINVEYDQGAGSSLGRKTNNVAVTHRQLVGNWAGWPNADPSDPGIAITEGGARLSRIASVWKISDPDALRQKQAQLLQANWDRMYLGSDGAGVHILTWYLFYTDVNFDAGLCETDGTPRPAYATWKSLPSF
jgi:hypothetical protein